MNKFQYSYFGEVADHLSLDDLDIDALSKAGEIELNYDLTLPQVEMGLPSGPSIVLDAVNGYLSGLLTEQEAPDAATARRTLKRIANAAATLDAVFNTDNPTMQRLGIALLPIAYNTEDFRKILPDLARRATENQELVALGQKKGGRPEKLVRRFFLIALFRAWRTAGGSGRGVEPSWSGDGFEGPFYSFAKAVVAQLLNIERIVEGFPLLKHEALGLGAACFDVAKEWEHFDYGNPESFGIY